MEGWGPLEKLGLDPSANILSFLKTWSLLRTFLVNSCYDQLFNRDPLILWKENSLPSKRHNAVDTAFTLSFKGFAGMFRPLYKKNPQRMESIHKQFTEELQRTIQVSNAKWTSGWSLQSFQELKEKFGLHNQEFIRHLQSIIITRKLRKFPSVEENALIEENVWRKCEETSTRLVSMF